MLPYHSPRTLSLTPHRDVWLEINLGALEHNTLQLRRHIAEEITLMAVIKSDAYGHGATMVAPILEACGFSQFGVASIDEALQLREAGVEAPILVLGASPDWAMPLAAQHRIQLTVFNQRHIDALLKLEHRPCIHLKVDTGMHRVGVAPAECVGLYQQLVTHQLPCQGIFSHLAKGGDKGGDAETTLRQYQTFVQVLEQLQEQKHPLPRYCHLSNSAGQETLMQTASLLNLARIGLHLYGYGTASVSQTLGLQPVMGLKGRVVHLQWVEAGEGVSYGHTWVAPERRLIATIPVGYADGVPRGLSNRLQARYHGQVVSQVGTITMDQLMLDVTTVANPQLGDAVTLLETGIEATQATALTLTPWANALSTIEYELLCGLRVRLPRVYVR